MAMLDTKTLYGSDWSGSSWWMLSQHLLWYQQNAPELGMTPLTSTDTYTTQSSVANSNRCAVFSRQHCSFNNAHSTGSTVHNLHPDLTMIMGRIDHLWEKYIKTNEDEDSISVYNIYALISHLPSLILDLNTLSQTIRQSEQMQFIQTLQQRLFQITDATITQLYSERIEDRRTYQTLLEHISRIQHSIRIFPVKIWDEIYSDLRNLSHFLKSSMEDCEDQSLEIAKLAASASNLGPACQKKYFEELEEYFHDINQRMNNYRTKIVDQKETSQKMVKIDSMIGMSFLDDFAQYLDRASGYVAERGSKAKSQQDMRTLLNHSESSLNNILWILNHIPTENFTDRTMIPWIRLGVRAITDAILEMRCIFCENSYQETLNDLIKWKQTLDSKD